VKFSASVSGNFLYLLGKKPVDGAAPSKYWRWYWLKKPANEHTLPIGTRDTPYETNCGAPGSKCVGDDKVYTTPALQTPGHYTLEVQVTDGCSTAVRRICFEVICNCDPTAYARADTFLNQERGKCTTKSLVLDGTRSYDFDLQTVYRPDGADKTLTYQWDMVSWTPAPVLAFKSLNQRQPHGALKELYKEEPRPTEFGLTWFADSKRAASATRPGYQTRAECNNKAYNDAQAAVKKSCETDVSKHTEEIAKLDSCVRAGTSSTSSSTTQCFAEDILSQQECALTGLKQASASAKKAAEDECAKARNTFEAMVCPQWTYTFERLPREISMERTCTIEAPRGGATPVRIDEDEMAKKVVTDNIGTTDLETLQQRATALRECNTAGGSAAQCEAVADAAAVAPLRPIPDEHWNTPGETDASRAGLFGRKNRLRRNDVVATSCLAAHIRTIDDERNREVFSKNCTKPAPVCEKKYTFCSIQISNADKAQAQVTVIEDILQADKSDEFKSLEQNYEYCRAFTRCRGRFDFRLRVRNVLGCKESSDNVHVTFRCSRPPVAIAGKKTIVRYQTDMDIPGAAASAPRWPQVSLDGRSSYDRHGTSSLTYVWSFLSYPEGHEQSCVNGVDTTNPIPPQTGAGAALGAALVDVVRETSGDKLSDGKTYKACRPEIYTSAVVAAAQPRRAGDAAFFTPTVSGNYTVLLSVFDGCSVITDTVEITAICPDLEVAVTLTSATGSETASTFLGNPVTVTADCEPSGGPDWWLKYHQGNLLSDPANNPLIKYAWSVTWNGDSTKLISDYKTDPKTRYSALPTTKQAKIELKTFGTFTIACSVSDGCQTKTSSKTHTVTCGSALPALSSDITATPIPPILLEVGAANGYPVVKVSANAPGRAASGLDAEIATSWSPSLAALADVAVSKKANDAENVKYDISIKAEISPANKATQFDYKKQPPHIRLNHTLNVQLYAYDRCQRNPTPKFIAIKYDCDTQSNNPPSLNDPNPLWSYKGNVGFAAEIDASNWKSPAYEQRLTRKWYKRRNDGQFTILTGTTGPKLDIGSAKFVDGKLRTEMSIPPTGGPQQAVNNIFYVRLTVDDGCTTETRDVKITYGCTSWPTASLTLQDQAALDKQTSECDLVGNPASNCVVHWNSYDQVNNGRSLDGFPVHGQFPQIYADITSSTNAAQGDDTTPAKRTLKFDVSIKPVLGALELPKQSTLVDNRALVGGAGGFQRSFRPPGGLSTGKETYEMNLVASHDDQQSPCKSNTVVRPVETKCNKITTPDFSTLEDTVSWKTTRFGLACIDLRGLRYVTDDVNQTQANLDSIKYTWKIKLAPPTSMFKAGTEVEQKPGRGGLGPDVRCREAVVKAPKRSYNGTQPVTIELLLGGYCPTTPPTGTYQTPNMPEVTGNVLSDPPNAKGSRKCVGGIQDPAFKYGKRPDDPQIEPEYNPNTGCQIPISRTNDTCVEHPWETNVDGIRLAPLKSKNYWGMLDANQAKVRVQLVSYNSVGQKTLSKPLTVKINPAADEDCFGRKRYSVDVTKAAYEGASHASQASLRVQVITDDSQVYPDLCNKDQENMRATYAECLAQAGNPTSGPLKALCDKVNAAEKARGSPAPKGGCLDAMYINFTLTDPLPAKQSDPPYDSKCQEENSVEYCTTHVQKKTTVDEVELENHHYNLPYTCFRPDVAGEYRVELEMDDGCTKVIRESAIKADCPSEVTSPLTKINVEMRRGESTTTSTDRVTFDGRVFTRVILDARTIEQEAVAATPGKHLDFAWSMVGCPMSYDADKGPQVNADQRANQITNAHGAKASFVPRYPGTYQIQLVIDDHCNPPQVVRLAPVLVNCSVPNLIPTLTVKKGSVYDPFSGSEKWADVTPRFRNDSRASVLWPIFNANDVEAGHCRQTSNAHRTITLHNAIPNAADKVKINKDTAIILDGEQLTEGTAAYTGKVIYDKSSVAGIGCWSKERFRFEPNLNETCSTAKYTWLISERTCSRPYTPPKPTITTPIDCPPTEYKCEWELTSVPCDFDWNGILGDPLPESCTNNVAVGPPPATCSKIGEGIVRDVKNGIFYDAITKSKKGIPIKNPLPNLPEREKCNIHFKCRHPGTYSLLFTISDDCSRAEEPTTVSCQCATTPTVRATRTLYESLYTCNKDIRRFASVEVSVSVDELNRFELKRCDPPAVPKPLVGIVTTCPAQCPTAPVCPQCPQCPQCPPCGAEGCNGSCGSPGSLAQSDPAAIIAAAMQQHGETARALAASSAEQTEMSLGPVMGVILPMSAVMLFSIFGNLLLFSKISERRNRKAKMLHV
jgi:hypothetical protein